MTLAQVDLVQALEALSDRERQDFALWADGQPKPTSASSTWGQEYVEEQAAVEAAANAFDRLQHDQTFKGSSFFDPSFPCGWVAWRSAQTQVRAMASAIHRRDLVALSLLAKAFEKVGVPETDSDLDRRRGQRKPR